MSPAKIIDGKAIAEKIKDQIRAGVAQLKRDKGVRPGLCAILVGDDPASQTYVRNKEKACGLLEMNSFIHRLPADLAKEELIRLIERENTNPQVHGLLVQLPLPDHLSPVPVAELILPGKDVDGLHPYNFGRLFSLTPADLKKDRTFFVPATPTGVIEILKYEGVQISGKHAVVVGRSQIVGKPIALLLLAENATVTLCHTKTADLGFITRQADILIAAAGQPRLITADMVKEGAVVIDVGTNWIKGKFVGDVDFEAVAKKVRLITPVPGGVGPLTIAMLMKNTLQAAQLLSAKI